MRPGNMMHPGDRIYLSPKHGLNPAIPVCFFCGKEKNEIVIPGRLKNDMEAPRHAVWNKEPCSQCKEWMALGVILASVKDGPDKENPYRTGRIAVIKEEAAKEIFDNIGDSRFAFVTDEAWDELGLPREDVG